MKKLLLLTLALIVFGLVLYLISSESEQTTQNFTNKTLTIDKQELDKEESREQRALYVEERFLYEYNRQVNPLTGKIPLEEKQLEFDRSIKANLKTNSSRSIQSSFVNRGPSNFGGRTRALVIDKTNSNVMLAGGVSGGVFRTTNGGLSWTKVSSNNEIHNVTAIVQDPRSGFENIWYYGTGEAIGNSANLSGWGGSRPAAYFGQGIWQSTDSGVTWSQMGTTASTHEAWDSRFDTVFSLAVDPNSGKLYAAINGRISSFNGSSWDTEVTDPSSSISTGFATDVVIASDSRVYGAFSGKCAASVEGVWTKDPGTGTWTRISGGGTFTPFGRVVLALAPSNQNKLYVLFENGNKANCDDPTPLKEADLWMWNQSNTTFIDYSSKVPDEAGCKEGIDPFTIQGGYDLVVSVKPDNENFVVIGGTNAYKLADITGVGSFTRIGGYAITNTYAPYMNHHPDLHAMVFDPNNTAVMYTGSDGGVHKTTNISAGTVSWTSLNNNYQTFQYYHVNIDPMSGSDIVIGGAQDNGTSVGGIDWGMIDSTTHYDYSSGDGGSVAISREDACLPFFVSVQLGVLYRDCPTFAEITPETSPGSPWPSEFVTLFHMDPVNNNTLYYAAQDALLRTNDALNVTSSTWTSLGTIFGAFGHNDYIQSFATSWGAYDASSYLLIGGDEGHIYRLDNPQNAAFLDFAVDITPPTATIGFPSIVSALAVHPSNNNIILATYANYGINSIYLSTDKGANWTLVERNLSAHSIRSAAIVEDNGETHYFVGTARGLYSSPDPTPSGSDWVREAQNEIGFALVSDLKYRPADHKLLIGTHGNGMFEATISSTLGLEDFNNISNAMRLYPNPVQDYLSIKLPQADGSNVSYAVLNLSGQRIFSGTLDNESLDVSALTPGMYFLQIKTNDGRQGAKSFIKK